MQNFVECETFPPVPFFTKQSNIAYVNSTLLHWIRKKVLRCVEVWYPARGPLGPRAGTEPRQFVTFFRIQRCNMLFIMNKAKFSLKKQ